MPARAGRVCKCGGRIRRDRCDRCGPIRRRPDRRASACRRGYDRNWRRFRRAYLAQHPLCHDCQFEGLATEAVEIHHIKKVADHPELRFERTNQLGLCKSCLSKRTARGE